MSAEAMPITLNTKFLVTIGAAAVTGGTATDAKTVAKLKNTNII
jgi:hypothetical protein